MRCRQCGSDIEFGPFREKSLSRCHQFAVLAIVLGLISFVLYVLGVEIWPWWVAGAGLFVLSQALLKWHDSRWVICRQCGDAYSHWGCSDH